MTRYCDPTPSCASPFRSMSCLRRYTNIARWAEPNTSVQNTDPLLVPFQRGPMASTRESHPNVQTIRSAIRRAISTASLRPNDLVEVATDGAELPDGLV